MKKFVENISLSKIKFDSGGMYTILPARQPMIPRQFCDISDTTDFGKFKKKINGNSYICYSGEKLLTSYYYNPYTSNQMTVNYSNLTRLVNTSQPIHLGNRILFNNTECVIV